MEEFELEVYNYKKQRAYIILILLVVAMVAINTFIAVFTLTDGYRQAFATITNVNSEQITYEFTMPDGRQLRQVCDYDKEASIGDTIVIYYNVENPSMIKLNMEPSDIVLIVLGILIEVMVVLYTAYLFIYYKY